MYHTVFVVALWWVDAGQMPGIHQSQPLIHICSWAGEKKCNEFIGGAKDQERSLTKYRHGQNTLELRILIEFITNRIRAGKK